MTQYGIVVIRNNEVLFSQDLTADAVIEIIRALKDSEGPEEDAEDKPDVPKHSRPTGKKEGVNSLIYPKPCCGSKGPRHKRECEMSGQVRPEAPRTKKSISSTTLSPEEFRSVKECKDDGMDSFSISKELMLDTAEVKRAFDADDYGQYSENK